MQDLKTGALTSVLNAVISILFLGMASHQLLREQVRFQSNVIISSLLPLQACWNGENPNSLGEGSLEKSSRYDDDDAVTLLNTMWHISGVIRVMRIISWLCCWVFMCLVKKVQEEGCSQIQLSNCWAASSLKRWKVTFVKP